MTFQQFFARSLLSLPHWYRVYYPPYASARSLPISSIGNASIFAEVFARLLHHCQVITDLFDWYRVYFRQDCIYLGHDSFCLLHNARQRFRGNGWVNNYPIYILLQAPAWLA